MTKKKEIEQTERILTQVSDRLGVSRDDFLEEMLQSDEFRNKLSIAITHFAFRNGPIEGMHSDPNKNITNEDMKTLNKYMVDSIDAVLKMLSEDRFFTMLFFALTSEVYGNNWDKPNPESAEKRLTDCASLGASFGLCSFVNKHNISL